MPLSVPTTSALPNSTSCRSIAIFYTVSCTTKGLGGQRRSGRAAARIRRRVFLDFGGFDESYLRPAIEDIDLGYRLFAGNRKIILNPVFRGHT